MYFLKFIMGFIVNTELLITFKQLKVKNKPS